MPIFSKNTANLDHVPGDVLVQYLRNPNLPAEGSKFVWTKERLAEVDKCAKNMIYFAENYFTISTIDKGKQKIKLYKAQKRVLKSLQDNRFVVLLSSRQSGKTTLTTICALHIALFEPDSRIIVVANKEASAKNILRRIKMAYEQIPVWLKPTIKQWDVTEVVFGNDSSIMITSTTSTAARGETAKLILIDEMSYVPASFMEDFWRSTIPVISSSKKSKIFAISTSNGTGNKFYDVYSEAERGDSEWKAERIDWWEIPGRDEKWKRSTIQQLGSEEAFNVEFGNSFEQTGESPIKAEIMLRLKKAARDPDFTLDDGMYKIWEAPKPGRIYVMGADAGEGIGQTASVINILDITDLTDIRQAALYKNTILNPYQFAKVIFEKAGQWGSPYVALERNGVGQGVLDTLFNQFKYTRLISYAPSMEITYERQGILSHTNVKSEAVTNYRYWFNELDAVTVYDVGTIQEMQTFVRHPNGTWKKKSSSNIFDDCVMSLIWGLFILKPEVCQQYFEILKYDDNGKPLKIKSNDYDEALYFGTDVIHKSFQEGSPISPILTPLQSDNFEMDDLLGAGWRPF